ncbi:UNVERIFIED_CONTAM: hypothetical protein FKN15_063094 [Acipenser sinensis]
MEEASPASLTDLCLSFLSSNLDQFCWERPDGSLSLRETVVFPQELADQLLRKMATEGMLNDSTVGIFRSCQYLRLRRACICKARISAEAFHKAFCQHRLLELDASGVNADVAITDIIQGLSSNKWNQESLQRLVLNGLTLSLEDPYERCFSRLAGLRALAIANVDFYTEDLSEVCSLPRLESLDISNTCVTDLAPLLSCRERLRSLTMHHLKCLKMSTSQLLDVLSQLAGLQHLDISDDKQFTSDIAGHLLEQPGILPQLCSLDVSGRKQVTDKAVKAFVQQRPGMHFIGLLATGAGFCDFLSGEGSLKVSGEANEAQICEALRRYSERAFFVREALFHLFSLTHVMEKVPPDILKVSGEANEAQICEALRRYSERAFFVREALFHLFSLTHVMEKVPPDILKLVVTGMKTHPLNLHVQLAASACVFNLTKQDLAVGMPVRLLGQVTHLLLEAMKNFPNHQQVSGEANEAQICEALRRYSERAFFVREALFHLFSLTHVMEKVPPDILKLVVTGMKTHPLNLHVQLAASACVFNLTKQDLAVGMPVRLLGQVTHLLLEAMKNFPNHQQVSGEANEAQICEALRRYSERAFFVREALFHLFSLTHVMEKVPPDILKLVVTGMKTHPLNLHVQLAASACVFNVPTPLQSSPHSQSPLSPAGTYSSAELPTLPVPTLTSRYLLLCRVPHTPSPHSHQQLQKNCLLSLCSDRILQEVPFNRFEAPSPPSPLQQLLHIVKQKTSQSLVDTTLKFTLSALWNLTDESPTTCRHFIENQGLELFMKVLESFPSESSIQQKVLGLLNNIAEVKELHAELMWKSFVEHISVLLHSSEVEVSYFAAGIIAHLMSRGEEAWTLSTSLRTSLLQQLHSTILKWPTPECEMVAYSMLIEEGGMQHLYQVKENPQTHPDVQRVSSSILESLERHLARTGQTVPPYRPGCA